MSLFTKKKPSINALRKRADLLDYARTKAVKADMDFSTEPATGAVLIHTKKEGTTILVNPVHTRKGLVPMISVTSEYRRDDVPFDLHSVELTQMPGTPEEALDQLIAQHAA